MYQNNDPATVCHDLTPDVMERVDKVIDHYKEKPGCLIPVLAECQALVGYLPVVLQRHISSRLNIPGSVVFGVVTFYSFFTMIPRGRHTIKACMGTACYVRGIAEVLNRIRAAYKLQVGSTTHDRRFSLESVRCLGACGLAPVVVIDDTTHGGVTPEKVVDILKTYI